MQDDELLDELNDEINKENELDDLGILGPNEDFGELFYEDIEE